MIAWFLLVDEVRFEKIFVFSRQIVRRIWSQDFFLQRWEKNSKLENNVIPTIAELL